MADIILYDLPSRQGYGWSENTWKARFVLNYKEIPYRTEFLEYPNVAPTLKSLGVPPRENPPKGYPNYTCPTVRFDEKTIIMDSRKIAPEAEKRYPTPSIHLDSPILPKVEEIMTRLEPCFFAVWFPKMPAAVLNPEALDYFYSTREVRFGMPLPEFAEKKGGEVAWAAAKPHLDEMVALLKQNGGPFFMGDTLSYSDIILVTYFLFGKLVDDADGDRLINYDESFRKVYDACKPWFKKDR